MLIKYKLNFSNIHNLNCNICQKNRIKIFSSYCSVWTLTTSKVSLHIYTKIATKKLYTYSQIHLCFQKTPQVNVQQFSVLLLAFLFDCVALGGLLSYLVATD